MYLVGPVSFKGVHTRPCRPTGLTDGDPASVANYVCARIGHRYDLRNVLVLTRAPRRHSLFMPLNLDP